ncbi:MAG: hypothetical protein M1824_002835 [Vezdaea acicularis]|nr:MAG: hypothetical protein M1824_002835 [Vezdaea acicularis]
MRPPTSLRLYRLHASPQSIPPRSSLSRHRNSFHTTAHPRFLAEALNNTLDSSSALLTQLHTTTHLPWSLTLPLTALLVRVLITGPLSLYTRRAQQRQLAIQPLLSGWSHHLRHEVVQKYGKLGPVECEKRLKLEVYRKKRELYKRAGCAAWKSWLPLTQLPVFLFVVEGVRRLCGTHDGLLGLLTKRFTVDSTAALDETQPALLETLESIEPSPIDPTLATEGILWFPNLLHPDPLLLLPFLLSSLMFGTIHHSARSSRRTLENRAPSKYQRRLTNTLKIVALAIGPLTLQLPAAMLLYWISSAAWALVQNLLLERFWPLGKLVGGCRLRNGNVIAGAPK